MDLGATVVLVILILVVARITMAVVTGFRGRRAQNERRPRDAAHPRAVPVAPTAATATESAGSTAAESPSAVHVHAPERRFSQQGVDGLTDLMLAAGSGHDDRVRELHRRGADVNAVDSDGDSVLCYAASRGRVSTVNLLLNLGADPDPRPNNAGESPLTIAARLATPVPRPPGATAEQYTRIVRALLRAGADAAPMYDRRLVLAFYDARGLSLVRLEHVPQLVSRDDLTVIYMTTQLPF